MILEPVVVTINLQDIKVSRIKVLALYIHYPLTMARYFMEALQHRDDVELIKVGPCTDNFIPWKGGMNLSPKYSDIPDIPLPIETLISGFVDYDFVKHQLLNGWIPDLVLCIDAGIRWRAKPSNGLVAHVATDPHVLNYDLPRWYSDKFFNMQKVYIPSGSKDIWLPYAYSKYDFYPDDSIKKESDAVLIGMPYEKRIKWVDELRKRGISVIFENGPILDEARGLYNHGKIGLNWSSALDLNCRAFELAAMKLCPVSNYVPDMDCFELFSNFQLFHNLDEAVERVVWVKEHPLEAQEIADKVFTSVQPHTFDARVEQIMQDCGF